MTFPSIVVADYGMANLRSVERAIVHVGGRAEISSDPEVVGNARAIVLPGVGAFSASAASLRERGLEPALLHAIGAGVPFLGICVGMQLLFEVGEEKGDSPGLGVFAGRVVKFDENRTDAAGCALKVPQIGWNSLAIRKPERLLRGIEQESRCYFVHSYYPVPSDPEIVAAESDYGGPFCCAIERDNVMATQFHPEKSGSTGLRILRNFLDAAESREVRP